VLTYDVARRMHWGRPAPELPVHVAGDRASPRHQRVSPRL